MKKGELLRDRGGCISDQASNREENKSELREILLGESGKPLSEEAMRYLLPKKIREMVKNPENIVVRQLRNESGEIAIIAFEKDFPEELTDRAAYDGWRHACAEVTEKRGGSGIVLLPPAPTSVNRLHARFNAEIQAGKIALSDRILFTCKIKIQPDNKKALHVIDFDGESGHGIAQDFYIHTLPPFCKELGLRYITGDNNSKNAPFFKEKLGRFFLHELKPEFRTTLFPTRTGQEFFTIQFLYDEDRERYVEEGGSVRN